MLTADGVEDASIAMYENVKTLNLNSCLDKHEWIGMLSQFPATGRGFQNTPCPAVRFCVCRVNTDRKKDIILCYVLFDH